MLTKEILKSEIDKIDDGYTEMLYRILKAFQVHPEETNHDLSDWQKFVRETYGCLADDPIDRGDQGSLEIREVFE